MPRALRSPDPGAAVDFPNVSSCCVIGDFCSQLSACCQVSPEEATNLPTASPMSLPLGLSLGWAGLALPPWTRIPAPSVSSSCTPSRISPQCLCTSLLLSTFP